ncbi:hypothetical protein BD309DRAFT_192463 [Dichomitus squalens]|nr:hypothetical protein BD309DRAFT_192463 [Dichomitus squalens]
MAQRAPSATGPPNQHMQRLNGAIARLEDLGTVFETFQSNATKALRVLREEVKELREELKITNGRVGFVESLIDIEEEGENEVEEGEGVAGEVLGEVLLDPVQESINANQQSKELADGKAIKDVVNETYQLLLGIPKLYKKYLPAYPDGEEEWPTDSATGHRLLRFNWYAIAKDPVNAVSIKAIVDAIRATGAERVQGCAPFLPHVLDAHLLERITTKFYYLAKQYKAYHAHDSQTYHAGNGEGRNGEDDIFGGEREDLEEGSEGEGARMEGALRRARAATVAAQRERKARGTPWDDAKYAAAFLVNAQSDNEDEYKEGERPPGAPIRYKRRRPGWRSTLLQQLYDEVDARPDPTPDKARMMVERVMGTDLERIKPPKALLKNRVRAWMVKDDVLERNRDWLEGRRVARDGKLWGEEDDPVEDTVKRKKDRQGGGRKAKRPRADTSAIEAAHARVAKVTGGIHPDFIFDALDG